MRPLLGPDTPFSPRRVPFFYGWVVVCASTVGVVCSIPGQTMGVSVFTDSLIEATGLNRLALSNAYLLGTLASAALLPRAGRLLDRFGVRTTGLLATLLLSGVLTCLAQVDGLADRASSALGTPPTATVFAALVVLFLGLRFSGQGVLTLTSQTMMSRWFRRRRGMAAAVSSTFVAFGFAAAPQLFDAWIGRAGWRGAWTEMAWVELGVMGLVAFTLFRESPESCGLRVDGAADSMSRRTNETTNEAAATRAEALRTRAFWLLTLGLAQHGLAITGITLHIVDLGADAGLARREAVSLFLPMAVLSTASGALLGWLTDRTRIRTLLFSFLVSSTVGIVAAAHLGHPLGWAGAVLGLGLASGHYTALSAVGLPRFFGREHLGSIAGASMSAMVVGSALGPSTLALSHSVWGSYAPALYAIAWLPLIIGVAALGPAHPRDVPPR